MVYVRDSFDSYLLVAMSTREFETFLDCETDLFVSWPNIDFPDCTLEVDKKIVDSQGSVYWLEWAYHPPAI